MRWMRWKKLLSGEKFFLSELRSIELRWIVRMQWKKISPLKSKFHKFSTELISTLILYWKEISLNKVKDAAVDYKVGDTHNLEVRTLVRQSLFCKNSRECGEKNFQRYEPQKFTAFNAKKMQALCGEKCFFQRYLPLILHYFLAKPRPGYRKCASDHTVPDQKCFWSDSTALDIFCALPIRPTSIRK